MKGLDAAGLSPLERALRALQDPTRRGILASFEEDARPRTVDEVAAAAGVHRTVARSHLEQLAGLGLLVSDRRRGRLGKPAKLYRWSGGTVSIHHPARRFAELATALAGAVAELGDQGAALAHAAGLAWGRRLARPGAGGVEAALSPLAELGARPSLTEGILTARTCVFAEACAQARAVVCAVQAGLVDGLLEAGGVPLVAHPCGPTDDGRGCRYRLGPAAARP